MTQAIMRPKGIKSVIRFRVRSENGVLIPEDAVSLPSGKHYIATLQPDPVAAVDALAEIALMAQPLGPADLARNFDTYSIDHHFRQAGYLALLLDPPSNSD